MKHLHHFNLADDPFRNEPLLRFYFDTDQQRAALQRMDRAVRQAKGLCVLTGEVGAGKTMAVRQLLESLEEEVFEACMMVVLNGAADASWMLTRFARQLGVGDPPREREALIAEIYDRLAIIREDGRHAVLIIDDAQALALPETLSEICGLLKLEYEDRRLLSLVLAGTPALSDAIASDPVLSHRVDVRVELQGLDPDAARAYLMHRVSQAGGGTSLFDVDAIGALHRFGRGIPGLMNTLADNALFEAFLCRRGSVTALDVERACRDLGWAPDDSRQAEGRFDPVTQEMPVSARNEPTSSAASAHETVIDAVAYAVSEATVLERPHAPASLQGSLEDIDSDLEAVFDPGALRVSTEMPIDPTSPEAIGSFAAPRQGPPKDEDDAPDDLLVELIED